MSKRLYDLNAEMLALMEAMNSEDIPDETKAQALAVFYQGDVAPKIEGTCHAILNLTAEAARFKAEATSFDDEAKRLKGKAKAAENSVSRLKTGLATYLTSTGAAEAKAGTFSVRLTESYSVDDDSLDMDALPMEYRKYEARKDELRKALLDGEVIPGAALKIKHGVTIR